MASQKLSRPANLVNAKSKRRRRRQKRKERSTYFPRMLHLSLGFDVSFVRGMIILIIALLIALCRPYKKMCMNVCDTLLLSHMAIICFMFSQNRIKYYIPFMQALILLPFALLVFVVFFRLLSKARRYLFNKSLHLTQFLRHCCLKDHMDDLSHTFEGTQSLHSYGAIS